MSWGVRGATGVDRQEVRGATGVDRQEEVRGATEVHPKEVTGETEVHPKEVTGETVHRKETGAREVDRKETGATVERGEKEEGKRRKGRKRDVGLVHSSGSHFSLFSAEIHLSQVAHIPAGNEGRAASATGEPKEVTAATEVHTKEVTGATKVQRKEVTAATEVHTKEVTGEAREERKEVILDGALWIGRRKQGATVDRKEKTRGNGGSQDSKGS